MSVRQHVVNTNAPMDVQGIQPSLIVLKSNQSEPVMENNAGFHGWLTAPWVYDLVQFVTGAYRFKRQFIQGSGIRAGQRVLDLGCGTGAAAGWMPKVEYLGIDLSSRYVNKGSAMRLPSVTFRQGDCVDGIELDEQSFDYIFLNGLLHHLDVGQCERLLENCRKWVRDDGHLLGFEPAWVDKQSFIERAVMRQDRGSNILSPDGWKDLLGQPFSLVNLEVVSNRLVIPYTLVTFDCSHPRR